MTYTTQTCVTIVIKVVVFLILFFFIVAVTFNIYIYPRHGLSHLKGKNHYDAMLKVGQLFATSSGLHLEETIHTSVCSQEGASRHYAWNIFSVTDQAGNKYLLWVAIRFNNQLEWYRDSVDLLIDPQDKLVFSERRPKNVFKTISEIDRIYRESKRQLREYCLQ